MSRVKLPKHNTFPQKVSCCTSPPILHVIYLYQSSFSFATISSTTNNTTSKTQNLIESLKEMKQSTQLAPLQFMNYKCKGQNHLTWLIFYTKVTKCTTTVHKDCTITCMHISIKPTIHANIPHTLSCVVNMRNHLLLSIIFALFIHSLACPTCPKPPKSPPPPTPKPKPCPPPPAPPKPKPFPPPPYSPTSHCPIDTLKLGACVDILGGLVHAVIGAGATESCCPVLSGLTDLDAALCLCTTIKAKLLDIKLILPIALELLVDCGKHPAKGYQCPA